jgi:hypothetical protein
MHPCTFPFLPKPIPVMFKFHRLYSLRNLRGQTPCVIHKTPFPLQRYRTQGRSSGLGLTGRTTTTRRGRGHRGTADELIASSRQLLNETAAITAAAAAAAAAAERDQRRRQPQVRGRPCARWDPSRPRLTSESPDPGRVASVPVE